MRILAVDTSAGSESIALVEDGTPVGEWFSTRVGLHSRYLVGNIKRFVESMGVGLGEIELFAVTTGPGSFTGLRVGISTIKGLAWVSGRATAGVSTLEALAMNIGPTERTICPIMDAKQKELYTALFRYRDGRLERLTEDRNIRIDAFGQFLRGVEGGIILVGDGIGVRPEGLKEKKEVGLAPERFWHVRAQCVGLVAWQKGLKYSPHNLVPAYIRKSHAELKKEESSR